MPTKRKAIRMLMYRAAAKDWRCDVCWSRVNPRHRRSRRCVECFTWQRCSMCRDYCPPEDRMYCPWCRTYRHPETSHPYVLTVKFKGDKVAYTRHLDRLAALAERELPLFD